MVGLFKTLLIIFGIYFLLRFLLRYFGPSIMRYFIDRLTKRAQQQFHTPDTSSSHSSSSTTEKKTGKTTIDYIPPNDRKSNKDQGEYIDFEEID